MDSTDKAKKSPHAEREERVMAYWKERDIFRKSLEKNAGAKEFIFYEGPPTANGHPGIHHLEARAFKDAIPRYKTMRGYHVRRKGGWDTHGLPVELQVEKELGLKSKKEIETYGIGAFNEKCKESVWKYVREWEDFTGRMGYWVDLADPYITYRSQYIESIWNIIQTVNKKDLLYKDYKVVPWCPRCGTGLSSHELAQGYQDVKDLAVTVKFKIKNQKSKIKSGPDEYLLAWTTTPWTLPGNVALAVGKDIEYVRARIAPKATVQPAGTGHYNVSEGEIVYLAKDIIKKLPEVRKDVFQKGDEDLIVEKEGILGRDLVGLEYEPLYPFLKDAVTGAEKDKLANAFKVYAADFVTTTDGTGIVHIAPMYGQDDFEVGTTNNLPKHHLVNDDGTFKKECSFLAGRFVKDEAVAIDIIKDLAHRGNLFHKEKHEHSYPFCWRCKTPLIYFARDSWYIRMSSLRDKLVGENEGINWEPTHIKEGRFGEWLREIKDWAISRERYWGTPLPIWTCDSCGRRKVVGSVDEIARTPKNTYFGMRHGEAEQNVANTLNSDPSKPYHLTEKGRKEVEDSAHSFKGNIDVIYASPLPRTRETAEIAARILGIPVDSIVYDERLREMGMGELEGKSVTELDALKPGPDGPLTTSERGIESKIEIKRRVGAFLDEMEKTHTGKRVLVVSHDSPLWMLESAACGYDAEEALALKARKHFFLKNAEITRIDHRDIPRNADYELDLHRPHIDAVKLDCSCGGTMSRAKEVIDVWFDSGAMPFAQDHYPFNKENSEKGKTGNILTKIFGHGPKLAYPADFISEAIDQTRGWFYTLHAIGVLMGKGKAYKNVICLGHILDSQGKKMSKSIGNIVDPWLMMNAYGADALRFWMYSVNQPGDSKNFEEKTVDEIVKKVFNLASNVLSFYKMYEDKLQVASEKLQVESQNVLDKWIISRLNQVVATVTGGLEAYKFQEPTRSIRDFVADLSQWYLRRSRDRFKSDDVQDREDALQTTRYVLLTLSKIMAPFTPFFAEELYREVGGSKESVHLEEWPEAVVADGELLKNMELVRSIASKGLEARSGAKINVRQPLQKLKIKNPAFAEAVAGKQKSKISEPFIELIKDEVNVKEIVYDGSIEKDVELDLNITPELKEEGIVRELIRAIQDLRKTKGLNVNDKATLTVETDDAGKAFIEKNKQNVLAICSISDISFGSTPAPEITLSDLKVKLSL